MQVLKFGGTSVGSVENIKNVVSIINTKSPKIVVLSAMSGTTNHLVKIAETLYVQNVSDAVSLIAELEQKYYAVVLELFTTEEFLNKGKELIKNHFKHIKSFTEDLFTHFEEKAILAQGELLSTALVHYYLSEQNIDSKLISALNFVRTDKDNEPDTYYIKENLKRELANCADTNIVITQGFICRNSFGEIDNLKRGGSDYSASLIGAAINAEEIQIWTDIDGMHNNDPRIVKNTHSISHLSFDEAAELAYFGAKILHPSSIFPAKMANVPVRLKNTMEPAAEGTYISNATQGEGIKAIAAKDNIIAIKIKSDRMLLAYGFLRKIFEIFEFYKTSIDMITTSEVAVSLTIDDTTHLNEIESALKKFGVVEVEKDLTIICVVGDLAQDSTGNGYKIFEPLKNIPIRMISYGGSKYNTSFLINSENKSLALNQLHQNLFNGK